MQVYLPVCVDLETGETYVDFDGAPKFLADDDNVWVGDPAYEWITDEAAESKAIDALNEMLNS